MAGTDVLAVQQRQIMDLEAALSAARDEQRRQLEDMSAWVRCLNNVLSRAEQLLALVSPGD